MGEAKPVAISQTTDAVQNPATIQRPESEVADENRHDGSSRYGCMPRKRFDPADVELFPGKQGGACSLEVG
jgi:hypothetical protein